MDGYGHILATGDGLCDFQWLQADVCTEYYLRSRFTARHLVIFLPHPQSTLSEKLIAPSGSRPQWTKRSQESSTTSKSICGSRPRLPLLLLPKNTAPVGARGRSATKFWTRLIWRGPKRR